MKKKPSLEFYAPVKKEAEELGQFLKEKQDIGAEINQESPELTESQTKEIIEFEPSSGGHYFSGIIPSPRVAPLSASREKHYYKAVAPQLPYASIKRINWP